MAWLLTAMAMGPSAGHGAETVAGTPAAATAADGRYISWVEHRIDDEGVNGGEPIRGGDGLELADVDADGHVDVVSVHEDSHHLRIAFGSTDPDGWELVTVARGAVVGAIEDVAVGDLNGDGWLDLVTVNEEAHLAYFQNPGAAARTAAWPSLVPSLTTGRGSWLQVALADLTGDGALEVLGANKGFADVVRLDAPVNNPTSLFRIAGDPLDDAAWQERALLRDGIPNQAKTVDIDRDGDEDVLAASRLDNRMLLLINGGADAGGELHVEVEPIRIVPGFAAAAGWRGVSNAFDAAFADLNDDGRPDLLVNVLEFVGPPPWSQAGLGWLAQPADLDEPWTFHRIGSILPDWVIGIGTADIDGDGDVDAIVGGYSGLNVLRGGYSGASRDADDPSVSAAATVARIAWFENPGDARKAWRRHDVSRRVRGMYDVFAARDMDGDGDVDFVATRGNSGMFDGVFWLEQRRTERPAAAFTPARSQESRHLPLPPADWRARYGARVEYVAPNKEAQREALER